ncbi:hypothetical protein Pla123a_28680 [Posidoniimonas polymericola]|uniref:Uncharacterized protein n=1 Tax=Posidoniimonas polymericola TaxID=2528002 RepID=A0A5C5YM90_9BACT|nr:hypothetical protein [Posidoniimonas polymericola]TWT76081.1 hypothetical protein Pla123a_28680 [Posidoniimonas polymericola]
MAKTKTAAKSTSKKVATKTAKKTTKKASPKKKAASSKAGAKEVSVDRRRTARRTKEETAEQPAEAPKLERREKVSRRRQIDPTTCERDYSDCEVQFMNALDDYKRKSGRMFPTCSEVLEVIRGLGYVQLSPAELAARAPAEETDLEAQAETEAQEALAESAELAATE